MGLKQDESIIVKKERNANDNGELSKDIIKGLKDESLELASETALDVDDIEGNKNIDIKECKKLYLRMLENIKDENLTEKSSYKIRKTTAKMLFLLKLTYLDPTKIDYQQIVDEAIRLLYYVKMDEINLELLKIDI